MRHILVMNAKGGCGKSTLATNIAAWYAAEAGNNVVLADFDPQASSLEWLSRRSPERPPITGLAAWETGLKGVGRDVDVVVMDAPARSHGKELTDLVRRAETVLVPVLPSPIDIEASERFITEVLNLGKVERKGVKLATVANRVREHTLIYDTLQRFLDAQKIPQVTALREAQNYIRAFTRGIGVFELPEYLAWPDWEQWLPLVEWLESRRSQP